MSYDRVLPKPIALHHDSTQVSMSRPTSNLLEHKIMHDDHNMADHRDNAPSYRYSESIPRVNLPSMHRARVVVNSKNHPASPSTTLESPIPTSAMSTKTMALRERSSHSDRSSSTSPVKSAAQGSNTQFCLCQPDPKIPRPRNAFILYRQHFQGDVVKKHPGLANPDISKIIGEQWRQLPQDMKDKWKLMAEQEKARHQQQYPEYRYQPRRYGRDGASRSSSSGLSHNPPGSTTCTRCGGRIMNPPVSPDAVLSSGGPTGRTHAETNSGRSYSMHQPSRPLKHVSHEDARSASRSRQWEESGSQSPDSKRRRTNPSHSMHPVNPVLPYRANYTRDKIPAGPPYTMPPYPGSNESLSARPIGQIMQPPKGVLRPVKEQQQPDPSLKLPPLQTAVPLSASMTPVTPFPQDGFNVEAAVMNIPFLNKIKLLAKIAPQLPATFREGDPKRRGPVIAVDGQDATAVKAMTDYLDQQLQKEGKFYSRIFEGPKIFSQRRESSVEPEEMGDKQVEYFNRISKWHQVSEEIKGFVKSEPPRQSSEPASVNDEEDPNDVSPRTIVPKAAEIHISSPPQSSEAGSEAASSPRETPPTSILPVAIVPRYQLTTADAYACMVPIADSYNVPDHWQWMASLWRGAVGPDITIYVRECDANEMKQVGGNPVEIRLHDSKTVIVRRPAKSPKELEEKVLKRVGFEIEDFLTQ
ncbi:hypothetical protein BJY04DRAFT_177158 [Aspergillus karnatakaensis]|uniref:putative HMG box transcriptional regulator n=1 Tax=Aspergillus karnatakaensis TaxID=1810916 RepID=UPI003CCD4174